MSSQNNKYSTTHAFIGAFFIIVIFIGIYTMMYSSTSSTSSTSSPTPLVSEQFTVENYPQVTPMNVMYSDSNGNLATTTDLGLQNLTVSSDSSFGGNVGITGKVAASSADVSGLVKVGGMIDTPSLNRNSGDWLRINDQGASVGQTAIYGGVSINDTREYKDDKGVVQSRGGLSVGDWKSDVGKGNIDATGRILARKNLQTNRNRVCFSNGLDDPNHSIYNNNDNIDKEGAWDGMKMNVYAGLDVRTGNAASGVVPKNVLSVRDEQVNVNGKMNIHAGAPFSVPNKYMSNGSLTVGDINKNFGGGAGWNANTAGLMMECADNTEIAIHDSGTRLASAMNYNGPSNTIEVGRDMGWGPSSVSFGGQDVFKFGRYWATGTQWKSTGMAFNDWHAMITGVDNTRLWEQNNVTRVAPINGVWHIYVINSRYQDAGNGSTVDVTFLSKRMRNSLATGASGY
jgi:hypothetical protein